jgi:hypothetical protein
VMGLIFNVGLASCFILQIDQAWCQTQIAII